MCVLPLAAPVEQLRYRVEDHAHVVFVDPNVLRGQVVPLQQSRVMMAALEKKEIPAKLIVVQGGGHPWLTIHEEVALLADWFDQRLHATPDDGPRLSP